MRSFSNYIAECHSPKSMMDMVFEAKFSNFNSIELKAFADELEELKKQLPLLNELIERKTPMRVNMGNAWFKTHFVGYNDELIYGNKYILIFDNPFTNGSQLTLNPKEEEYSKYTPCTKDEDDKVYCIAIADKFGKLHLVNQWGNECTVQKRDKLYIKTKGDSFYSEKGWYLYRKGFASYYVNQKRNRSEVNDFDSVFGEKQPNTFVRLENCYIFDMSILPKQFEKIQKEIEEEAKRRAEYQKQEEERLRREEARKKWWKDREDYTHLGCANGWSETPEEIKKASKDPEAKWYEVRIGRCYNQYFCDKYKITYTVDSSD